MRNKLYDRKPVGETIFGSIAKQRAIQEPRNNLLLQLGLTNQSVYNRQKIKKDFDALEANFSLE